MSYNYMSLIDVCEAITDGSHYSPQEDPNGAYYMASVRDMGDYEFDFSGCKIIGEEDYRTMQRNGCCPEKGDILIGKDGANFYLDAFIYDQEEHPAILSSIAILKPNRSIVNHEYLFAYLRSPAVIADVRANYKSGSAIPRIVLKDFKRLPVWVPDIETQSRIARVYTAFNHKIRLNQKTNDYLSQVMETLYRKYFTYDNQPFGSIYDIAEVVYGAAFSSKLFNEAGDGWPLIRIRDLTTFSPQFFTEEEHPKRTFIEPGDVVAGMDADFTPTLWLGEKAVLNQRVCEFVPPVDSPITKSYLLCATKPLLAYVQNYATGTTVAHLGKGDLEALEVPLPREKDLVEFGQLCEPMRMAIVSNAQESIRLAKLRDALLPKLMSGEIDISQIELPTQLNNHLAD